MTTYHNEFDPNAAAWIRQLAADGAIAPTHVDDRSITEIQPHELTPYAECHFFAGLAGWSRALDLVGQEDPDLVARTLASIAERDEGKRTLWTASLPCQPFSSAGKQGGTSDERHLWPVFRNLVEQCRPSVIFGEQVASKIAREEWLPGVCMDLQALGYTVTAVDLCAPCAGEDGEGRTHRGGVEQLVIGAPHIRQRLYWVAYRGVGNTQLHGSPSEQQLGGTQEERRMQQSEGSSVDVQYGGMVDTNIGEHSRRRGQDSEEDGVSGIHREAVCSGLFGGTSSGGDATTDHRMAQPRSHGAGCVSGAVGGCTGQPVDTGAAGIRQDHRETGTGGADPRGAGVGADHRLGDGWQPVSFAADCLGGGDDEFGDECALCGRTYADDCQCPGPTQDGYEYAERDGTLYARRMGDAEHERLQGQSRNGGDRDEPGREHPQQGRSVAAPSSGAYSDFDLIPCRDGKLRRAEPSSPCLAPRLPRGVVPSCDPGAPGYANETAEARTIRLKGYGNAICAPLAALFITEACHAIIEQLTPTTP